jgi:polyhydroxyalkanoate synthesis regulator phasin
MSDPGNFVLSLLRELRSDIRDLDNKVDRGLHDVDQRFDKLDKKLENIRQASFGESVLGRYAAAEVEERMEALEKRVSQLENTH